MRLLVVALLATFASSRLIASGAVEVAKSSDSFVDSIGVNTHYLNAVFTGQNGYSFSDVDTKLAALGVRHIRDNALDDATFSSTALSRIDGLYSNYNIHALLVPGNTNNTPQQMANVIAAHPAFEAVEGLNEPDGQNRTYGGFTDNRSSHLFPATVAFQNDLWSAVQSTVPTVSVLSPAMANSLNSQYITGASNSFSFEAMHSYPSGQVPTNNLDTRISQTNAMSSPSKPIIATETGYYTKTTDGGEVSETAMGKYVPRLFAEYFDRGVKRTYEYELIDQNPTTDRESNFGLLRWDRTPKPAYTALMNLISLTQEPGANSVPGTLDLTINGAPSTVHHTVLEKSNGTFDVLIWNDLSVFNTTTQADITNADVGVQLVLGSAWPTIRTYLPGVSTSPQATFTNANSLDLGVPDQVMVVELVPEPSSFAFVGGVFLMMGLRRRRRLICQG